MDIWMIISMAVILVYVLLMLWLFMGISKTAKQEGNSSQPSVSVVVSLRNESHNIDALVGGLKNLQYPNNLLEIILVNDNSTDSTYMDLLKYQSPQIMVLNNTGEGKKRAIETGVRAAKGDWIAVTDADCTVPAKWIYSLVQFVDDSAKMILAPVFISNTVGVLSNIQSIEFMGLQGATCGSAGMNNPISANGANMMFNKEAFLYLKPYENNYALKTGDDQFLMMAIANEHLDSVKYARDEDAIVYTKPVGNWNAYFSQRIRWASKGNSYTRILPQFVGLVVFSTSIVIILSLIIGMYTQDIYLAFGFLGFKLLVDLLLILPMKRLSKNSVNPLYYLVSGIIYPFVVMVSVLGGGLKKPKS